MLNFLEGDAVYPIGSGNKIIAHVCNNKGAWGAGFTRAINSRWKRPELDYRLWHLGRYSSWPEMKLGMIQIVNVEDDIWIANMIAQVFGYINGQPPIRYYALEQCLTKLVSVATKHHDASIHMPDLIGCGLAGGNRDKVLEIINNLLPNINIYIYKQFRR
jgi:O-acetyl-ADP-ribose deacetylase (regulator of RNase III)